MAEPIRQSNVRKILIQSTIWPALSAVLFIGVLLLQINALLRAAQWVDHTDQVIQRVFVVQKHILDSETGLRGYLLTGREDFFEPYRVATTALPAELDALASLVSDNPSQIERTEKLRSTYASWLELSKKPLEMKDTKEMHRFLQAGHLGTLMASMRAQVQDFIDVETRLREARTRDNRRASLATITLTVVLGIGFFLVFATIGRNQLARVASTYEAAIARLTAVESELRKSNEELEARVAARTKELEAINGELEAFTYSVSHDLRAPLRAINGFAEILRDTHAASLDDQARDFFSRIINAARKMGRLIDDLLTLSRITRTELVAHPFDISEAARHSFDDLKRADTSRDITIDVEPGLQAFGDSSLVQIVLDNLIGNAWKYTQHRSNPVIRFGRAPESGGKPVFFVQDNGVGFDPKYAAQVFKPFERLHGDDEFEGTGIGLTTVARIVERHGGEIRAEAVPGEGAKFTFSLADPREQANL